MGFFVRSKFSKLARFFSRLPVFSNPHANSLHFLNCAQFMGVLNDNIFKLVIAFLLIDIEGQSSASSILSMAGAIFVIPFILFSSAAGILADRFSKQRLIIGMKIAEMLIMGLAMLAFGFKIVWASYLLLFLLATHSALFGPSKYAIISELIPAEGVPKANGLITSFTYLGVIIGTFLASFVTEITDRHFVLVAGFCLIIAGIGFLSTFGIAYTPPQGSKKRMNLAFVREIFHTLSFCRPIKHLLLSMTGAAYFLFIGAYTQLNIIPFAIESLHLTEIDGGYLFLATALGIALGSFLAGKISSTRAELGLACISGFAIAINLILLSFFSHDIFAVISLLLSLGVFGGLFIVPFDSFVQVCSPDEKRGQVIAANNFLSFIGVLLASFALYFYSQVLCLTPAQGFFVTGLLTLGLSVYLTLRLSDHALPFFAKLVIKPFTVPRVVGAELLEKYPKAILVLEEASWIKVLLLLTAAPKTNILVPRTHRRYFPWFNWLFYSIHLVPSDESLKPVVEAAKILATDELYPCIFVKGNKVALSPERGWRSWFQFSNHEILSVEIEYQRAITTIRITRREEPSNPTSQS